MITDDVERQFKDFVRGPVAKTPIILRTLPETSSTGIFCQGVTSGIWATFISCFPYFCLSNKLFFYIGIPFMKIVEAQR